MKLLVTGASGMVGRNVLENPAAKEYEIVAPSHGELDLLDTLLTQRYVEQEKPDAVLHCAGRVGGIQANMNAPATFMTENLLMGTNLVLAARRMRVPRFLNLGSSCMYPKDSPEHLTEDMLLGGPLEETNEGYALAKIAVSRLCDYVSAEESELSYKTIVPCNLYGRFDSFDPKNSHMLPAAIRKVHEASLSGAVVEIWGNGEARREFMYAGDLADFLFFALDNFDSIPALLNVGLGEDLSINEYYHTIAKSLGVSVEYCHNLDKPTGMRRKVLDVSRVHALGWRAKTSTVDGICSTFEYYRGLAQ